MVDRVDFYIMDDVGEVVETYATLDEAIVNARELSIESPHHLFEITKTVAFVSSVVTAQKTDVRHVG